MQERKVDPAVLVDIPNMPDVDQLSQVDAATVKSSNNEGPAKDAGR